MKELRIKKISLIVLTILVGIVSLFSGYPTSTTQIAPVKSSSNVTEYKVTDATTANNYLTVLGNRSDGGRYAGRVWTDKSVYQEGMKSIDGIQTNISLDEKEGEEFLIAFSALGSSRILRGEATTPVDLVLILDVSTSMDSDTMTKLVTQTNRLINQLMDINASNRVGVVVYGGGTEILLPLDHYRRNGANNILTSIRNRGQVDEKDPTGYRQYNTLKTNVYNSKGELVQKTSTPFWADSTYLQGALYQGMEMLATETTTTYFNSVKQEEESRIPAMIVMSDGGTNIVSASSTGRATSGSYNWWEPYVGVIPRHNGTQYYASPNGNPIYASVSVESDAYREAITGRSLAVLMTAGYMRKAIEDNYNTSVLSYSIGLNMENLSRQEKEQLYGTLDPANYFKADSSYKEFRDAYSAWKSYLSGQSPTITWNGPYWVSANLRATWNYNHVPTNAKYYTSDFTNETDLNYIDRFYEATDDTIGSIFDRIVTRLDNVAFHPVSEVSGTSSSLDLTYTDPIGEYMEVKNVKGLTLFGNFYQVQQKEVSADGKTTTYKFEETHLNHPSYVNPVTIDLSQILVQVTEDNKGFQTMTIGVPEGAIPLRLETVTLKDSNVESYKSNSDTPYSLPLRVLYSVGLKDSIKVDTTGDGKVDTVDLGKISDEYKKNNRNSDGTINFYSNLYTGNKSSAVSNVEPVGNATVVFEPSMQNRYYYFQKNRIIYSNSIELPTGYEDVTPDGTSNPGPTYTPVTNIADLEDDKNYYLVIDYYRPTGNIFSSRGEYVNYIVQRTGEELKKSVTYYNPTDKTVSNTAGTGYVVATAIEGTRLGRLNRFTNEKNPGVTETAHYAYAPTNETGENGNQRIRVYLGNNGKLRIKGSNLTLSKKVAGNSGDEEKNWNFTITLKNGELPVTGEYSTGSGKITFSDLGKADVTLKHNESVTIYNLPEGATYEIEEAEANQDGYVTTSTNASGVILENDTITSVFTNTKNVGSLTISKMVNGNGGNKDKEFHFVLNLYENDGITPVTGTYSCGNDCTYKLGTDIILKNGESFKITGIKTGLKYTVLEREENQDGYKTTKENAEGTITDNNINVSYVNTREVAGLTLKKIVAGNGRDENAKWHFKVTIGNNKEYDYKDKDGNKLGTIKGSSTIELKHNEQITIEGIEIGTTYSIEEIEANRDDYVTTVEDNNATGTISKDGVTVTYKNTKELRNLEISKIVLSSPENESKDWHFTVKLTKNNQPVIGEFELEDGSKITFDETGGKFALKHNEKIVIKNLPVGTSYKIIEEEANQDGMITTISKTDGEGTIELDNDANKVVFTNSKETGTLVLTKKVTGNDSDKSRDWHFKIVFEDATGNELSDSYQCTGCLKDTIKSRDTITLRHGESIIIHGLSNVSYRITEEEADLDGYITTIENDNAEGTVSADKNTYVTFINHKEVELENLTISKTVTGIGDKKMEWSFKVILTRNGQELTDTFKVTGAKSGEISSGDTFTLKSGEFITIEGLKEDTKYKIIEEKANKEGYQTTVKNSNAEGTIKKEAVNVEFINHKEPPVLSNLILSKKVVGTNIDADKTFTFIVVFPNSTNTYEYEKTNGQTETIKSGESIQLKNGEKITIKGLEEGTEYVISEELEDGYQVTVENDNAHGTFEKEDIQVNFINTKKEGNLKISKIVKGKDGDTQKYWNFQVILKDKEGNELENSYYFEGGESNGTIKSGDMISLKSGQSITIFNIDEGTTYQVVEQEANEDGYKTTVTNMEGTILYDETVEVLYTNTKEKKPEIPDIPNTYDNGNPFIWSIFISVSLVGIIACLMIRKKIA